MEMLKKKLYVLLLMIFCTITTVTIYESADGGSGGGDGDGEGYYTVPDLSEVRYDRSIFFIETGLMQSGRRAALRLRPRVMCALEAAARLHPAMEVYLVLVGPAEVWLDPDTRRLLQTLHLHDNFRMRRVTLDAVTWGTPVQALCRSRRLQRSTHLRSHVSDVVRLTLLWRYGGVYLDTDVVALRPLRPLLPDFVGAESDSLANGAAMGFGRATPGHLVLQQALAWLEENYSPDGWASNGPVLLTAVLRRLCRLHAFDVRRETRCAGVRVLPPYRLHPIAYGYAVHIFQANSTALVRRFTALAYTLHLWNQLTAGYTVDMRAPEETAIALVARQRCPRVSNISRYL